MLQDLDMDNDNEVAEQHELTPDGEIGFIGSSASVGCGHESSMNRMPPITNGEFPNEESGEGKDDTPSQ
jgi:hypothetical protein